MAAGSKESLLRTMDAIITELEQEGLINKYFRLSSQLKEVNGPYFFANLLLTFISDTHNALMEIAKLLDEEFVNFDALDQIAIKLKGSASCCIQAKNEIQHEFGRIHARLDAITQLEQQLILN
ncbi:hypothetical protein RND81_04G178600 [Saponaria officinalis]|uniref:Histidine-containing phosphotransfer protein n=1 Tax=Saponaria officinalis TaxID=3572 RepID=A0AAW1LIW0_SAPOF